MPKVTPFLADLIRPRRVVKTMLQMIDKIDNGGLKRAYAGGQEEEQQKEKQKEFPKARLDAQIGAVD